MSQKTRPQLRVIDNEVEHPLDYARRKVKEFQLDREKGEKPLPVSNPTDSGAPPLRVDDVLRRSEPDYARK